MQNYWKSVFLTLSEVVGQVIEPDPLIAIFGVVGEGCLLKGSNRTVAAYIMLLARRLVLLDWKSPKPPSHNLWLRDVLQNLKLEKLRLTLCGSTNKFEKMWCPFMDYAESRL